jgi:glycosyltransferase involved in cell wall biosynthesis
MGANEFGLSEKIEGKTNEILVSIFCSAYNHELYIRDAIHGFLEQRTNFRYEIIIHDDASTDKTAEIIKEYEQKYPKLIKGIYQTENQYSKCDENRKYLYIYNQIIKNCRGKYIASCDGDDYWIDPKKLQMQADYMEKHPECVMTAHNQIVADCKDFKIMPFNTGIESGMIDPSELIQQKISLQPSSRMYIRKALKLNRFLREFGIADYPFLLYLLEKGSVYYFDRIMSVYRRNTKGSWSESVTSCMENKMFFVLEMIDLVETYNNDTRKKFNIACICQIQRMTYYALDSFGEKSKEGFIEWCQKYEMHLNKKHRNILERLMKIYRMISNIEYLDEALCEFIRNNPKLFIMGCGKYAGIIGRKLEFHKIKFEGFVVSDNQEKPEEHLKKPVWRLSDIDKKDSSIIIGISPIIWEEIIRAIEERGIVNYICPFLI